MRIRLMFLLLVALNSVGFSQIDWLQTEVQASYSGVSQTLRVHKLLGDWNVGLGIIQNYSMAAFPWSNKPGVSAIAGYELGSTDKTVSRIQLLTSVYPGKQVTVTEGYTGYNLDFDLKQKWLVNSFLGFGIFNESGKNGSYVVGGFSYCVNLGLSYRFVQ